MGPSLTCTPCSHGYSTASSASMSASNCTSIETLSSCWTTVFSMGTYGAVDMGNATTNTLFNNSSSKVFRRTCPNCATTHVMVYYQRLTAIPGDFSVHGQMVDAWMDAGNVLGTDFKLFTGWTNFIGSTGAWTFCNYNDATYCGGVAFPRDCGPSGRVTGQWTGTHSTQRGCGQYLHPNIKYEVLTCSLN